MPSPPAKLANTDRPPRAFTWMWALLAVALVVRTGFRDRGVIIDHLEFGRRLLAGLDPYAPYLEPKPLHPPYPPSFGLLAAPFSLLSERLARFAWAGCQILALATIMRWLRTAVRGVAPRLSATAIEWVVVGTLLLAGRYVLRDTHGGGGNLINLALALGAFAIAGQRPHTAGLLLGFSLATKPSLILLLPLAWLLGRGRFVGATLVAGAGFALLSWALLGFDPGPWQRWFEGTWLYATQTDVFADPALGFPPFTWMNQSLRCALGRYLGEVPPVFAAQQTPFFDGLGWSPPAVALTRTLLSLGLIGAWAAVVWRLRHRREAVPALLAATLALSLLLSPISWKAHHVALLPAFALLFTRIAVGGVASGRRGLWAAVAIYFLACVPGEEIVGKDLKNLQQSLYLTTAGTLAFFAAALAWARK